MAKEEAKVERKLVKWAKEQGCLSYKFSSPANRGVPDRIFIGPSGKVLFLELKAPGEKPTALQMKHLKDIHKTGCWAMWVDSFEAGKEIILSYCLNPL